jgi:hypothetical protein
MDQVDLADIVVVLVAHRYGWIPSSDEGGDDNTSITWLEVRRARDQNKPILAYLVEEHHPWPPKHIETKRIKAKCLEEFKAELMATIADFFTIPTSLDGPISRDIPRVIERLRAERKEKQPAYKAGFLRSPRIYISDCGAPGALISDAAQRLEQVGLLAEKPVYSGYYIDTATEFYERCDFGILAMGSAANERYPHVMEEERLVRLPISVYFEPVDMSMTGFGAPMSGRALSLEDWRYRPKACFVELLSAVRSQLVETGWTIFKGELPDIELVDLTKWAHSRNWRKALSRAGFTLKEDTDTGGQITVSEEVGKARLSLFAWGSKTSDDFERTALSRAERGAAIIAIAEAGACSPD